MNDKKYSVSDLLLFNKSPFAYWCKRVNNLVEKREIDKSFKIPVTERNLYSEHFLHKTEAHEVSLKDYYLIQQEKNVIDFSSNSTFKNTGTAGTLEFNGAALQTYNQGASQLDLNNVVL